MTFLCAIAAIGFGAALAQDDAPIDGRFLADWDRRPTGSDFARHYPREAARRGMPGLTQLCCTPREDRTLECRVGTEWPADQGFGAAAVRISENFRMTPESYAAFQSDPANWLQVPIFFIMEPASPRLPSVTEEFRIATRNLCRPQPTAPAP